mgnify:CR=1 FL=1
MRGPIGELLNERSRRLLARTRRATTVSTEMEGGIEAVLAVTEELHGLGYLQGHPVGTRLKYSGGRRNKVKMELTGLNFDPSDTPAEIARDDVWAMVHWPEPAQEAESARPDLQKLREFRMRVAAALMSGVSVPKEPTDQELLNADDLDEVLVAVRAPLLRRPLLLA